MTKQELISHIDAVLKPEGFIRQRSTWRKPMMEAIQVIDLQKSSYSNRHYYINLGLWFNHFGDGAHTREALCQIRSRIERVPSQSLTDIDEALDLERTAINDETRVKIIHDALAIARNFLDTHSEIKTLKHLMATNSLPPATTLVMKNYLSTCETNDPRK